MKSRLLLALIALVSAPLLAADPDAKAMQGDWVPVKAELAGKPLPEPYLKSISLKIGDGTYDVLVAGKPDKGTVELDPAAKPKKMVLKGTDGPNKGKMFPCIYEFSGDTLVVCYDLSGKEHPKEFKTAEKTLLYLVTYQRKK